MAQKFHVAILRIEVTSASRGLSAVAELLVIDSVVQSVQASGIGCCVKLFCVSIILHYNLALARSSRLQRSRPVVIAISPADRKQCQAGQWHWSRL